MRSCRNDLTMMMTSYSYLPLFCLIEIPPSSSAACESENMSSVGGNYHYRPWIWMMWTMSLFNFTPLQCRISMNKSEVETRRSMSTNESVDLCWRLHESMEHADSLRRFNLHNSTTFHNSHLSLTQPTIVRSKDSETHIR